MARTPTLRASEHLANLAATNIPALLADEGLRREVEQARGVQGGVARAAARAQVRLHRAPVRRRLPQVLPHLVQPQLRAGNQMICSFRP